MTKAGQGVFASFHRAARHIGLPWRSATGAASNAPDAQGATETVNALWAAMLAAVASGQVASLADAMGTMSGAAGSIAPRGGEIARYHDQKYKVFRRMQNDHAAYAALMQEGE